MKVEWHRICVFRPRLAEYVLAEGSLVSSTYEQPIGKGRKAKTTKITSWSVRADVVRKLDGGEPQPESAPPPEAAPSEGGPF